MYKYILYVFILLFCISFTSLPAAASSYMVCPGDTVSLPAQTFQNYIVTPTFSYRPDEATYRRWNRDATGCYTVSDKFDVPHHLNKLFVYCKETPTCNLDKPETTPVIFNQDGFAFYGIWVPTL